MLWHLPKSIFHALGPRPTHAMKIGTGSPRAGPLKVQSAPPQKATGNPWTPTSLHWHTTAPLAERTSNAVATWLPGNASSVRWLDPLEEASAREQEQWRVEEEKASTFPCQQLRCGPTHFRGFCCRYCSAPKLHP